MINMKFLTLMVGSALAFQSCTQGSREKTDGTTTVAADTSLDTISKGKPATALQPEETAFIEKAATGGMMEVELGNLTTQKTKSPRVMEFAKRMIADHTRANQELLEIAEKLGLKVPSVLPSAEQGHITEMKQMQGNEYDQNYMQMMVNDHAKTIDLFNAASSFENEALKTFALKTLPVLQAHNKMAVAIDSVIRVKKPDNRGDDLPNVDKRHKN
jgi:putative membrane protein